MLVQFSVRNFKTFKEKATLSMVASNYDRETRIADNIAENDKFNLKLLKSAVIYGANASGKSKFLEALMFMKRFIVSLSKDSQIGDEIPVDPFRLNSISENSSSEFEIIFIHKSTLYRYGFELDKDKINSEWLYCKQKTKEVELYYRDFQEFEIHPRKFKKGAFVAKEGFVRNNALLLPLAAQFNEPIATEVIGWFKGLKAISGLSEIGYQAFILGQTKKSEQKQKILKLLRAADPTIRDIELESIDINDLPKNMPDELKERILKESRDEKAEYISDVLMYRKVFDDSRNYVKDTSFSIKDESSGTKKFFALTGPILHVVENGFTLIVDELDSKLHPNLVCKLISIFNSKDLNPKNAQLVFNTHDTNLLDSGLFRRDQIWFTEKNKYSEAQLYCLADFKTVRKTEALEDNYIRGKYGAVPYLGGFDTLFQPNFSMSYENEK